MTPALEIPDNQFAGSAGVKLRYRRVGSGEPLLLIMGYGPPSTLWHLLLPLLVERFDCVYYDHRGTGLSDVPEDGYTIWQYAQDARAVLDAIGWESAHIYGGSMGGMIAQQIAIDAAERVRSLVLASTACGAIEDSPELRGLDAANRRIAAGEVDRGVAAFLPYLYGDLLAKRPEITAVAKKIISEEPPRRLPDPPSGSGPLFGWDVVDQLGEIVCPTLVAHGADDCLFPLRVAQDLFARIPDCEARFFKNSPHAFYALDPPRIIRQIGDWILSTIE